MAVGKVLLWENWRWWEIFSGKVEVEYRRGERSYFGGLVVVVRVWEGRVVVFM